MGKFRAAVDAVGKAASDQVDNAKESTETGWRDLAKIAAAATSVVTLMSVLAVAGILGQAQRDHPTWFITSLGLVLGAAALWVLAAVITNGRATPWAAWTGTVAQMVGVLLFVAGTVCAVVALVLTQHNPNRPNISASIDNNTLTATVKARGLDSGDRVAVYVDGLEEAGDLITRKDNLYFASVGANSDGDVELPIKLLAPAGRFDALGIRAFTAGESECELTGRVVRKEDVGPGCIIVPLPAAPVRPQLSVSWAGTAAKPKLTTTATATNVGQQSLVVQVVGRNGRSIVPLSRSTSVPTATGDAHAAVTITVPRAVPQVCIAARLVNPLDAVPNERCPVTRRATAAIFELRVP